MILYCMKTEIRRKYAWYKGRENSFLGQTGESEIVFGIMIVCTLCTGTRQDWTYSHTIQRLDLFQDVGWISDRLLF